MTPALGQNATRRYAPSYGDGCHYGERAHYGALLQRGLAANPRRICRNGSVASGGRSRSGSRVNI